MGLAHCGSLYAHEPIIQHQTNIIIMKASFNENMDVSVEEARKNIIYLGAK